MSPVHDAAHWLVGTPMMRHVRTRGRRRLLAVATVVVIAAMPIAGWLTGSYAAVIALMVPYLVLVLALAGATRFLADIRASRLDEWHRRQRQDALADSYWPGTILALAGGLAIATAMEAGLGEGLEGGVLVATPAMIALLPTLALAWRLPDDVVEADDGA